MARLRECVDPALGAFEPAVDIVQQNLARLGAALAQLADRPRAGGKCGRAGQRLLAISRHDWRARAAAKCGITLAALMFGNEARASLRFAARRRRGRLHQHFDLAALGDAKHAEAEATAEIAIARIALTSLAARRHSCGDPDFVSRRCAIDRLQDQLKVKGELELADHYNRRIAGAEAHEIAVADLALHREAELFEKAFDGEIKRGFQRRFPSVMSDRRISCAQSSPDRTRTGHLPGPGQASYSAHGEIRAACDRIVRNGPYHIRIEMLDGVQGGN